MIILPETQIHMPGDKGQLRHNVLEVLGMGKAAPTFFLVGDSGVNITDPYTSVASTHPHCSVSLCCAQFKMFRSVKSPPLRDITPKKTNEAGNVRLKETRRCGAGGTALRDISYGYAPPPLCLSL